MCVSLAVCVIRHGGNGVMWDVGGVRLCDPRMRCVYVEARGLVFISVGERRRRRNNFGRVVNRNT